MAEQPPGTIVFYVDEDRSKPLVRVNLKYIGNGDEQGSNNGVLNLWLPTIFYKVRLLPLKVDRISKKGPEIALFKRVGGVEHLVWSSGEKVVDNPKRLAEFDLFRGLIELEVFPWGLGHYVVRAFAEAELLAVGELEVIALTEPTP